MLLLRQAILPMYFFIDKYRYTCSFHWQIQVSRYCLSKDLRMGVVIAFWRRSQLATDRLKFFLVFVISCRLSILICMKYISNPILRNNKNILKVPLLIFYLKCKSLNITVWLLDWMLFYYRLSSAPDKEGTQIFFFFVHENICCK